MERFLPKKHASLLLRISLAVAISILLTFFIYYVSNPKISNTPLQPKSWKLVLEQDSALGLTLTSIENEDSYGLDYKMGIADNYYLIQIVNGSNLLFSGQTPKTYRMIKENFGLDEAESHEVMPEKPRGTIVLHLPVFETATEIRIFDEKGNTVTTIGMADKDDLRRGSSVVMQCGDGICSDGENYLNCRIDCK